MKTVPCLVVASLCAASIVVAQEQETADRLVQRPTPAAAPATAAPATTADSSKEKPLEPEPAGTMKEVSASTCAVYPISFYGGAMLYQAEHFEDENCSPPFVTYLYGSFTYPQTCGVNCQPYVCRDCKGWTGLETPVPATWDHIMPNGKPRKYAKKIPTPDRIKYLKLVDIDGRDDAYVKLFSYKYNKTDLENNVDPPATGNFLETFDFAFECQNPAEINYPANQIPEITDRERVALPDNNGTTTVYDVTLSHSGNTAEAHILTFLCEDPDEVVQTPAPATAAPTSPPAK
jgi:hypothetical protein